MKKNGTLIPFVLLVIGTLGLLLNEFILDLGKAGTLTFAAVNLIGIVILGFSYRGKK